VEFGGGRLATGDIGFLSGQLFVLGRLGDSIKLRGRTLFADDVEAVLEEAGLPRHRQTVLLGESDGPVAVLVVENADRDRLARVAPVVARLTEGARVLVIAAAVGTIPRTTSGKPKRRVLWKSFLAGELPGDRIEVNGASS
jgi:acyl-CoA synthetase (AMP-forming)/AMP-acid ligase II